MIESVSITYAGPEIVPGRWIMSAGYKVQLDWVEDGEDHVDTVVQVVAYERWLVVALSDGRAMKIVKTPKCCQAVSSLYTGFIDYDYAYEWVA